jgi:BRCA1/BRCA2-containing complex subunit 3
MSLDEIVIAPDVVEALISHAFTSEREECVGLLFGCVVPSISATNTAVTRALVSGLYVLRRADRRPDRVEVNSEQVAGATKYLEKWQQDAGYINSQLRVIGWYHSHPHITTHASHIDLRTQYQYQQYLDKNFFGIILSTFNIDNIKRGRIELLAFQTMKIDSKPSDDNAGHEFTEANIRIRIDELAEVDPSMRASRYSSSMNGVEMLTELQKILWQEERDSYLQSVTPSETSNAGLHPLVIIHSSAVYQRALCRLLEYSCSPLLMVLQERKNANARRLALLLEEKKRLEL